jgi:segregation and condensation protein A
MRKIDPVFTPDPQFTLNKALQLLKDIINRLPKNDKIPSKTIQKVMSLEEMINTLSNRITSHIRMSFKEFTKENRENRVHVIVSFLAMLELVKQGIVHVSQDRNFDDIHMETREIGVPRY